jgi:uncharacterized membrane protein YidH (DUF202 family)
MKTPLIIGIVLIGTGVLLLAYGQFNYRSRDTVLEVGPIKATAETTKSVPFPPIIAWALVAGGAGVVVYSALQNRRA